MSDDQQAGQVQKVIKVQVLGISSKLNICHIIFVIIFVISNGTPDLQHEILQGEVPQAQWSRWCGGGGAGVVMWHMGLCVAVVSGWVDSHSLACEAGWLGGGAAWRVTGMKSWDWAYLAGLMGVGSHEVLHAVLR
ncbi:hypothetical protein EDB89DRAFT_1908332 [Lactarius sanguifluus]|nr:hypothetical protein EDB89DRAFT_1908332 [Lactarius sanguifluus]